MGMRFPVSTDLRYHGRYGINQGLIAFPKNNSGRDLMLDAPGPISDRQWRIYISNQGPDQ